MQRIGVLGGMMDPVHSGHIHAAEAALNAGLDRVLLAPCQTPAHRPGALASAAHRLEMCRIAARADARLEVSDIELRGDTCYAVDTVRLLSQRYPGAQIVWIAGADKLPSLSRWYQAEALFAACEFYVFPRPGYDAAYPVPGARIRVLSGTQMDVSSGSVVERLRRLDDAEGLLPPGVGRYMAANGLYQPDYEPALLRYGMGEKRLSHTLGVRATAAALAERHGAPVQAAGVAGMLHDIAKPLPLERMRELALKYRLNLPEAVMNSGNLLHGPLAAAIVEHEIGITDKRVLSAIACHTTGKMGMSTLDKVLYIADAIEPGRADYPGLSEIRAAAETDLDAAVLMSMERTRDYVLARGLTFSEEYQRMIEDMKRQKEERT